MLRHKYFAPEGDLTGGGADAGAAAGGEADAGGAPADPGPSMEDTARAAYRELTGSGAGDEGEDTGEAGEHHSKTQVRANGKFAKAAAEGEQVEGQQAAKPEGEQQIEQPVQPKSHDAFPNTWRKDLAETWKTLPENARQEIHKREQDFHNGVKQYREAAGFGQSIAQEMLPYREIMQKNNVTPQVIVRDIMGALNTMATGSEESKASTFLQLATQYGINLDTVLSLRQRAPGQAAPDLSPVLQRVQKLETRIETADQERQRLQDQEYEARVTTFLNDPKNEHARTVIPQMQAFLNSGQAKDLQDAYEQAIWAHPETRAKLLEKQEADRRKKEADEVAAAKKASAANVHRRGTPPAPAKAGTLEDTARSVYRRHMPN